MEGGDVIRNCVELDKPEEKEKKVEHTLLSFPSGPLLYLSLFLPSKVCLPEIAAPALHALHGAARSKLTRWMHFPDTQRERHCFRRGAPSMAIAFVREMPLTHARTFTHLHQHKQHYDAADMSDTCSPVSCPHAPPAALSSPLRLCLDVRFVWRPIACRAVLLGSYLLAFSDRVRLSPARSCLPFPRALCLCRFHGVACRR